MIAFARISAVWYGCDGEIAKTVAVGRAIRFRYLWRFFDSEVRTTPSSPTRPQIAVVWMEPSAFSVLSVNVEPVNRSRCDSGTTRASDMGSVLPDPRRPRQGPT